MTIRHFDTITTLSRDNAAALVKSGNAAAEGWKALAGAYADLAERSLGETVATAKALWSVKTPAEFRTLSIDLAKASVDSALAEGRKLQTLAFGVVTDTTAPIADRAQAVASLFTDA
jgi:phasin family protein